MPPGTLFVVATPIGNLEDVTLRALRVLRECNIIAAEDTRRTARLLAHHGIATPTLSFHAHNTRARLPQLIERLEAGQTVAVVSDAGTPGISDPGVELVQACRAAGIRVQPLPGASAPLAAAVGSGFPMIPLTIAGFAPARSNDRRRWLLDISGTRHTCVFFEAPSRIRAALADVAVIMGDRPIALGRELTKLHEEFIVGTAASLQDHLDQARGEFTVVLGPWTGAVEAMAVPSDDEIVDEFRRSTKSGASSRREVISLLAKRYGRSQREVYALVERAKHSG